MACLQTVREDDFVEYFLFPKDIRNEHCDLELVRQALENSITVIHATIFKYTEPYIWNKDSFNLRCCFTLKSDSAEFQEGLQFPHLHGIVHHGDNIEDEWFIVFLLLQLTVKIEGLVVRVADADGEFLLIEAADNLPEWANPEVCQNRVYLYNGAVHIVPLAQEQELGTPKTLVPVKSAVILVRGSPVITKASPPIQEAVQRRINRYTEGIAQFLHNANVFVPVGVAALLKNQPNLVAAAVQAFCNRDPIDMKACNAMRFFPPETRVMRNVKFTRYLYAMLCSEKFNPGKITGWNFPPADSSAHKPHVLGAKLACGFEILVAQTKSQLPAEEVIHSSDLAMDIGWKKYLQGLQRIGYFQGLLEKSKGYTELLQKAEQYYLSNMVCTSQHKQPTGQLILTLLDSLHIDLEEMQKEEKTLSPSDDESWIQMNPTDLDVMLEEKYGNFKHELGSSEIPNSVKRFLEKISEFEGAEFPRTEETSETGSHAEASETVLNSSKGKNKKQKNVVENTSSAQLSTSPVNKVGFNPEEFSCALQNILDFALPEDDWNLESGSDTSNMSSYEDDEHELDFDENKAGVRRKKGDASVSELKQYMDQMDCELASSSLGQSFERTPTQRKKENTAQEEDSFDDVEHFEPVNIDMNALKNILNSYQTQMGPAGPAPNLLGPMGLHLEKAGRDKEV